MLKYLVLAMALFVATQAQVGGFVPHSVTEEVKDLAKWASSQLSQFTGVQGEHKIVEITNVQRQIVAGINYKMTVSVEINGVEHSCNLAIHTQSWTNTIKFIQAPKCQAAYAAAPGGFVPQPVTEEVKELAQWASSQLAQFTGVAGEHMIEEISDVQVQVVAGLNYKMTVSVRVNGVKRSCKLVIHTQSWTNTIRFMENPTCVATFAAAPGGFVPHPVTEEVKELAQWASKRLAQFTGAQGEHAIEEITNVQMQIVAGINFLMTVSVRVNGVKHSCQLKIFTQSWTNTIKFAEEPKCVAQTAGGFFEHEVDQEVTELAMWASSKLAPFTGVAGKHIVNKITNVRAQVVAGKNFKLTVEVLANGQIFSCDLFIFSQPWTNTKQMVERPRCL